jgi:hypothetical protein
MSAGHQLLFTSAPSDQYIPKVAADRNSCKADIPYAALTAVAAAG